MLRRSRRPAGTLAAVLASAAAMTFTVAILIEGHVDLPRALPFLALWTAAPLFAVAGTFMQSRGTATRSLRLPSWPKCRVTSAWVAASCTRCFVARCYSWHSSRRRSGDTCGHLNGLLDHL